MQTVDAQFVNNIFKDTLDFEAAALSLFHFQYNNNAVYRQWCESISVPPASVNAISKIPFLPISFFKTKKVVSGVFEPSLIFESSGTTQTINSQHLVKDGAIYEQSFIAAFEREYGPVKDWCVIGLLPSYLERQHSSLVVMVDKFIRLSTQQESGFYLYEHDKLAEVLQQLEMRGQKTLLIGVTFGLLDFAEKHALHLKHTIVMETGGMKGRRQEMTRAEVHALLKAGFGVTQVHSEYGMTELLSQAYSKGEGRFHCPPWLRMLVRDEEDPLAVSETGRGILNIIDLANVYSCSFIATDDVGVISDDRSFEVWGRVDNSDLRGCSLLVV